MVHAIEDDDYREQVADEDIQVDPDILYDVIRHADTVTISRANRSTTMDYGTFATFIMTKEAKPYTDSEIEQAQQEPQS